MPSDAAPDCAAHPVHPAPLNKKQSPPDLLCKHGPSFMSSVAERSIENELGTTKVSLPVAEISEPPHTLCAMQPDVVETLAGSIQRLGLHTPITVRPIGRTADLFDSHMYQVITGRHRLAAARKLGWTRIDAVILDCDKTEVRLWEIAE